MSERASGGGGGGDTTSVKKTLPRNLFLRQFCKTITSHSLPEDLSLALGTIKTEARSMAENFKCGNLANVSRRLCL